MNELEWYQGIYGDTAKGIAETDKKTIVSILRDTAAILGLEDLPEQPEGTTYEMLADKILEQARRKLTPEPEHIYDCTTGRALPGHPGLA